MDIICGPVYKSAIMIQALKNWICVANTFSGKIFSKIVSFDFYRDWYLPPATRSFFGAAFLALGLFVCFVSLVSHGIDIKDQAALKNNAAELAHAKTTPQAQSENIVDFSKAFLFFTKTVPAGTDLPPAPLSSRDARIYREIFTLQASGDMIAANRKIKTLRDKRLMGHVLFQRYTHPAYKSRFEDLRYWMARYADLPGADRIYKLAQSRMPAEYNGKLKKPEAALKIPAVDISARRASAKPRTLSEDAIIRQWNAGLKDWKSRRYNDAVRRFEIVADQSLSDWSASAGAYWAARAAKRMGDVRRSRALLGRAADHPRTFYGLLAIQTLDQDAEFNWRRPDFTREYYNLLAGTPEGNRAIALIAAGQNELAQSELLRLDVRGNSDLRSAVLAYASYAGLPALAMRMGGAIRNNDGEAYDSALYPLLPWEPDNGYTIDPALLSAIARQESKFNPAAESPKGALGLMQLMPSTASYVSNSIRGTDSKRRHMLKDPETSIEIAQTYIQTLLKDPNIKGDMLKLVVAYNAGPGNLAKWKRQYGADDPLLFIETIPSAETRAYVERVLASYWIYRAKNGQDVPTLVALAKGQPALYVADASGTAFDIASR
jgi:soluble lytic murein transglycosylase